MIPFFSHEEELPCRGIAPCRFIVEAENVTRDGGEALAGLV